MRITSRNEMAEWILDVYFSKTMGKKSTNFFLPTPIEFFAYTGIATVVTPIEPQQKGRVRFQATEWPARFYPDDALLSAMPDTQVKVIGREGIALLIAPCQFRSTGTFEQKPQVADEGSILQRLWHRMGFLNA
ncbi:MAG: hypothetical protein F6K19_05035 [Cyanothece sp. SIO1E1]|nr:hypothetical protein [Cyanothece sp. SIO1E1]